MKEKKLLIINFIAVMIAFGVNMIINFFLSSFIVNNVGEEAYGFTQLANTVINYFTIITLAINSMASRFISIEYHKNNIDEAKGYYSATFWANTLLMVVAIPILTFLILNLEKIINISPNLVYDVKLLFAFLSGNLLLGLVTTNLTVSYYIKNKLYIQSIINAISYIIKAGLLYYLYTNFSPYIAFVGLATFIATTFVQICNLKYKYKLIPEIKIKKPSFNKLKTLFVSGIWNSITRIGSVLSEGLDLLITNLFLDPISMGILAIVKIIPNVMGSAISNFVTIFLPSMFKIYASGDKEKLKQEIKNSMLFIAVFLNIPIVFLMVFGDNLFTLWFPLQNAKYLLILSIISISHWIIIGPASILNNVFTVINKIKVNSILICVTGALNILVVYILLKTTGVGLYAVVGTSCVLSIIRNICYAVPYGAKYLGFKWTEFFPEILKSIIATIMGVIAVYVIKIFFIPSTWLQLVISLIVTSGICFSINILVCFDKGMKFRIWEFLKEKVGSKNG